MTGPEEGGVGNPHLEQNVGQKYRRPGRVRDPLDCRIPSWYLQRNGELRGVKTPHAFGIGGVVSRNSRELSKTKFI